MKRKAGNRTTGKAKQIASQAGRGESAFETRDAKKWDVILKNIEKVVAHAQEDGRGTMDDPVYAHRVRVIGVRL